MNDLERNLHRALHTVPPPDAMAKQRTQQLVWNSVQAGEKRLSRLGFFFLQGGFLRKRVWILQLLLLVLSGIALFAFQPECRAGITLVSAVSPLLVLAGMNELFRSYRYGTDEIELSTRYSLQQVMLARICVLGGIDTLCLTVLLLLAGAQLPFALHALLLYVCVPFLITSAGCLFILNRTRNRDGSFVCAAWGIGVVIFSMVLSQGFPRVYETQQLWIWLAVFVVALLGVLREGRRMIRMAACLNCAKTCEY